MKKLISTTIALGLLVLPLGVSAVTYVDGYYRDSGTYVEGHYRTEPDQYEWNNYSFDGYDSYENDYNDYSYDSDLTNDISNDTYERQDYSIGDYRY